MTIHSEKNRWDHALTSITKPNVHGSKLMWWNQLGSCYSSQLIRWRKNAHDTQKDTTRWYFYITTLAHIFPRKTLKWGALLHHPYASDIALSNFYLFWSMAVVLSFLRIGQKFYQLVDRVKRCIIFSEATRKMENSCNKRCKLFWKKKWVCGTR